MRYIELHAIQTYPAGLPNRDANNQMKTLTYGGVLRARISSQCMRRAERVYLRTTLAPELLGMRTRGLPRLIADELVDRGVTRATADAAGRYAMAAAGLSPNGKNLGETAVLLFVAETSPRRVADALTSEAQAAAVVWDQERADVAEAKKKQRGRKKGRGAKPETSDEASDDTSTEAPVGAPTPVKDPSLKKAVLAALDPVGVADISLFGRMLVEVPDGGQVVGALQVAHAFSVEAMNAEPDFFVAVDDKRPTAEPGTGMMGYTDVGSHTMYRWACVDLDQLQSNLGPDVDAAAVARAYVESFCLANPDAKTTGSGTAASLPAWVTAAVTERPVNLADAFVAPIDAAEGSVVDHAAAVRLTRRWDKLRSGPLAAEAVTWTALDGDGLVPDNASVASTFSELFDAVAGLT